MEKVPGSAGWRLALPTEAQWEYACRAGTSTAFAFGDVLDASMAKFNSSDIKEVGSYPANRWGLHDMHGSVWEWCADYQELYPLDNVIDPVGTVPKGLAMCRGGAWNHLEGDCRAAHRHRSSSNQRYSYFGLRVVLVERDMNSEYLNPKP